MGVERPRRTAPGGARGQLNHWRKQRSRILDGRRRDFGFASPGDARRHGNRRRSQRGRIVERRCRDFGFASPGGARRYLINPLHGGGCVFDRRGHGPPLASISGASHLSEPSAHVTHARGSPPRGDGGRQRHPRRMRRPRSASRRARSRGASQCPGRSHQRCADRGSP